MKEKYNRWDVKINRVLAEKIKKVAEEQGLKPSDWVRHIITLDYVRIADKNIKFDKKGVIEMEPITDLSQITEDDFIKVDEVAKILHTAPMKVVYGIKNGTLPIGANLKSDNPLDNDRNTTKISKRRLIAWINADDLQAANYLKKLERVNIKH